MSNILTSYFRIYPKNKKVIAPELQQYLLKNIVQAYNRFGSYWVRIEKRWHESENALDIQFGSGKNYHTEDYILENPELYKDYYVWERRSNESGGSDRIHKYYFCQEKGFVDDIGENCKYGFDKIKIIGSDLEKYFSDFLIAQIENGIELAIEGTYFSVNDRSFQDLIEDSEYYGPCLGYDSGYIAPQFCEDGYIISIKPPELGKVLEKLKTCQISSSEIESIEFFWKGKIVNKQQWGVNELGHQDWLIYQGDNWDNCLNENFLKFRQDYHSKYL